MIDSQNDSINDLIEKLSCTKKKIIIQYYHKPLGYKRLSKVLGVRYDTIRSHISSGKYSRSLAELGIVIRGNNGWVLTSLGTEVAKILNRKHELIDFDIVTDD